jgi:hypothetical protein
LRITQSETAMTDVLREVRTRVSLMYFFVFMYAQTQGLPFLLIMLLCCFIFSFFLVRFFRVPSTTVIPHLAATFLKQAKSSMSCNNSDIYIQFSSAVPLDSQEHVLNLLHKDSF